MSIANLSRNSVFSEQFISQIITSNEEKQLNAPTALLIHSQVPEYNSPSHRHFLLQVAKTHRLSIQEISKNSELKEALQTSEETSLVILMADGTIDGICFEEKSPLKATELKKNDFSSLKKTASIFLFSPLAGLSFAQELSNRSNRVVIAAKSALAPYSMVFAISQKGKPQMHSFSKNQKIYQFQPHGNAKPTSSTNLAPFRSERHDYLKNLADNTSDPEAQFQLAQVLLENNDVEASYPYLKSSADLHYPKAQSLLGIWYMKGTHVEKNPALAVSLWKKAEEEDPAAAYYLALAYMEGKGGLGKSSKKAKVKCCVAALCGHSEAYKKLGRFYEHRFRKTRNSNDAAQAVTHFEIGARQGNPFCLWKMGRIYEEGKLLMPISLEQARYWYSLAAQLGHGEAKKDWKKTKKKWNALQLEEQLEKLSQGEETHDAGFHCMIRAAELGDPHALALLGEAHETGDPDWEVTPNKEWAMTLYELAEHPSIKLDDDEDTMASIALKRLALEKHLSNPRHRRHLSI